MATGQMTPLRVSQFLLPGRCTTATAQMVSHYWDLLPVHQLENKLFGLIAKAIGKTGIKCRADLHNNLTDTLRRLLKRTLAGRHYVTCLPTVDHRSRVQQRDAIKDRRTIQRHLRKLEALGLVELIHHATCTIVRFCFKVQRFSAQPKERQMSPHTFTREGEPLRVPPSVEKDPAGAAVPQCAAATRRPQTDTAAHRQGCAGGNLVTDPEISEAVSGQVCETQPEVDAPDPHTPEMTEARDRGKALAAGLMSSPHLRRKPKKPDYSSEFHRQLELMSSLNQYKWTMKLKVAT